MSIKDLSQSIAMLCVIYVHLVTVCSIQRWFVDGTVNCFTGGHLPLAIVAILILIFHMILVAFVIALILKKVKVSSYSYMF